MGNSVIPEVIPPGRLLSTDLNLATFAGVNPQLQARAKGFKAVKRLKKAGGKLRGMPGKIGQGIAKRSGNATKMIRRAGLGGAAKIAGRNLMKGARKFGSNVKNMGKGARAAMRTKFSNKQVDLILFKFPNGKLASEVAEFSRRPRRRGGVVGAGAVYGAGLYGAKKLAKSARPYLRR